MILGNRPATEDIRTCLDRILSSAVFSRSERLRNFLAYVVTRELAGEGAQLKGYAIAVDVFGRPADFNADSDPLVRVHAGKLRKLLDRYYDEEGSNDAWRILLPRGGYVPIYELQNTQLPGGEHILGVPEATPAVALRSPQAHSGWTPRPLSSPVALLSFVLPLLLFAPLSTPALSLDGALKQPYTTGISGAHVQDAALSLPFVTVSAQWPAESIERRFADSLRDAAVNYRIHLYPFDGIRQPPYGNVRDMRFSIRVQAINTAGDLEVALYHDPSKDRVATKIIFADALKDESDITFETATIAANWLKVTGKLFAYAEQTGISSPLMQCMTKTMIYNQKLTREAFASARACQRALNVRQSGDSPLVTNLNLLKTP